MAQQNGDWRRGGVIYQVYPRSFADSDGDGQGDLPGLLGRIPYLAALGIEGLWICPFYRSPMRDFGYDVADYCAVDPSFGTLNDFKAVLDAAHAAGLKVIVDQVYSHTSDKHPWFEESRASREGPRADWYVWADPKRDGAPPNNWLSVFGGQAWEWDTRRGQYYLHHFLAEQPQLNFHHPAVRREILEVAKFWLAVGVDGFRLDVANYYFHDAELRDNPANPNPRDPRRPYTYQRHLYDRSRPETIEFIRELRGVLDEKPGSMAVAEVFSDAHIERTAEYTFADRLHTAYSFRFLEARALNAELVRDALEPWSSLDAWPSWSFSNHDVVRATTRWGGVDAGPQFAKMLLTLLLSLRGTIFLYQGEELGLPQADVPFEKLKDPEGIRFWPHSLGRDGGRTPMPWTAAARNAGFSDGEPWLPVDARHVPLAVDVQQRDGASVLAHARSMIMLRRTSAPLREGAIDFRLAAGPALAFTRTHDGERMSCVFNLGTEPLSVPGALLDGDLLPIGLGGERIGDKVNLPPYGALLAHSLWTESAY